MKIQLMMLDKPLLVSDEDIKNNDYYCFSYSDDTGIIHQSYGRYNDNSKMSNDSKKIIAGILELPSIDLSGLSEEDCKKIGWVNVDKISSEYWEMLRHEDTKPKGQMVGLPRTSNERNHQCYGFIDGFKRAQSINEKRFTLDDIKKVMNLSYACGVAGDTYEQCKEFVDEQMSLYEPKVFDVEVEMEIWDSGNLTPLNPLKPKIIHNSIKVIKLI